VNWLSRLWQRWQRGGNVEPQAPPSSLPEDERILASPTAADQLEQLPQHEQNDVLDRDQPG
jgi:hypothetical protein